jgi:hypothetical protein
MGTADELTVLHPYITQRIHACSTEAIEREQPPHPASYPTDQYGRQLGAGVLCTDDQRSKVIIRSVKGVEPL